MMVKNYHALVASLTLIVALVTLWVTVVPASIIVQDQDGQDTLLGPGVADALNTGGLQRLKADGFPRATTQDTEIWGLEVDGHWTYMVLNWRTNIATLTESDGEFAPGTDYLVDVVIRTNQVIAQELYDLATGQGFDPGILGFWYWGLMTGVTVNSPDQITYSGGYKGAVESWTLNQL